MGKGSFDPSKTIGGGPGLCETAQNNRRRFSENFIGRLKREGGARGPEAALTKPYGGFSVNVAFLLELRDLVSWFTV
jgi:hypothetical protein